MPSQKPHPTISSMARRYALLISEAEPFAAMTDEELHSFNGKVRAWQLKNGFPNDCSPLTRGVVLSLLKGEEI
jgi:hypothetical protein